MHKILLLLAVIASLGFASSPIAMAQDDVDLGSIAKTVQDADQGKLMTALETPPTDEQLPAGFSDASYADPTVASAEEGVLPADELEDTEGSVAYMVEYKPEVDAGTPDPLSADFTIRIATLQYVFFDKELSSDDLNDFKKGFEEGVVEEEGAETSLEDIQIHGIDALMITYQITEGSIQSVVKMVILPVGNTMVITTVLEAGSEVDGDVLQDASLDLTVSGASHLGDVAESAR